MNRLGSAAYDQPAQKGSAPGATGAAGSNDDDASASVVEAARGSSSERLGRRFGDRSPILVFSLTALAGYLILAALTIGLGFLLVDVLLSVHVIQRSDEAVNEWLAANRSSSLTDASYVGSSIGDMPFIPALVIITALGAAILRRWRILAFVAGAILIEVATYRVTSLIVHRERPDVPRLDNLPVNQSYPSGHVAASVVVYIGLALLISRKLHDRWALILLWAVAVALPLAVILSRLYRGMHHPLDVSAGVLVGIASIAIALFATRAAGEASRARNARARG